MSFVLGREPSEVLVDETGEVWSPFDCGGCDDC